jgi:GTPase SAR1 family protein
VSARTNAGFDRILRRLTAPLQVAVVGRIKSGKSTLVNALIGRQVAPTAVGECTHLVTRFSYGPVDKVEIVFVDGTTKAIAFDEHGRIPDALGIDLSTVSHLEAYLTNEVLKSLTVIDTPGLGSLDLTSVARTHSLLGTLPKAKEVRLDHENLGSIRLDRVSTSAVLGAEAMLYVVTQSVRADDQETIDAFTVATARRDAGPANAIAVLNKADTLVADSVPESGGDAWRAAEIIAAQQRKILGPRVTGMLPIIGLLAQTIETGSFNSVDAKALKEIAATEQAKLDMMMLSADLFTTWNHSVSAVDREKLLEKLDLYGISLAIDLLRKEPHLTAGALARALLDACGLDGLRGQLEQVFANRADAIKSAAALASLGMLMEETTDVVERNRIRDAIEVLLAKPEAHQLRLLEALTAVSARTVDLDDDLVEEIIQVGSNNDIPTQLGMVDKPHGEQLTYAMERAGWWRSFATFGATPAQSRVAQVVHRTYFLIWQQLRSG